MARSSICLIIVIFWLSNCVAAEPQPMLQTYSLLIQKKHDDPDFFLRSDRTRTEFLLTLADKQQLVLIDSSSTVKVFSDDRGTVLSKPKLAAVRFELTEEKPKDHPGALVIQVSGNVRPAKGATKILVKGELVLMLGVEEQTTKPIPIDFSVASKTTIGDLEFTVIDKNDGLFNRPNIRITGQFFGVKTITVTTEDGKEIGAGKLFAGESRAGGWVHSAILEEAVKRGSIKITYFRNAEKLRVPVDLVYDLGL